MSTTCGEIQLILGPMFSGKTTELIKRVKRYQYANQKCMIIKYTKDNRYDEGNLISSHDNNSSFNASVKATHLFDVYNMINNFSVIGIDEGQFFSDILEFCEKLANNGKIVIIAALDATFQRKGFNEILNLVPLSESVVKLAAVCMICHNDAAFSKRKGTETQVELIGGKESYLAVCRYCYFKDLNTSPKKINSNEHISSENTKKRLSDVTNFNNSNFIN